MTVTDKVPTHRQTESRSGSGSLKYPLGANALRGAGGRGWSEEALADVRQLAEVSCPLIGPVLEIDRHAVVKERWADLVVG